MLGSLECTGETWGWAHSQKNQGSPRHWAIRKEGNRAQLRNQSFIS